MVDAGEIFAEIDASAGMVRFLEDPEQYTSSAALHHLDSVVQNSFSLAKKLQEVNTQVTTIATGPAMSSTISLLISTISLSYSCLQVSQVFCTCVSQQLCCEDRKGQHPTCQWPRTQRILCVQVSLDPAYVSKLFSKDRADRFPDDPSDIDAEPQSLAYSLQDG